MKKVILFSLLFGMILLLLNAGKFFDVSTQPKPSDIMVSLGGDNGSRIKKTLELYENNMSKSQKVILTGVDNFDPSMKVYELDWRAAYLSKKGVGLNNIVFNTKAKNTLEEVFFIKKYMLEHHLHSVIFVTDPPHSKRIDYFISDIAKYADANLNHSIVATQNEWWSKERYYTNPEAVIFVINESIKLTYYYLQNLLGNLHETK